MLRRAFLLASVMALASAVACKEETNRPPPASETSPPGPVGGGSARSDAAASLDGGESDGGACNDLTTEDAPAVDQLAVVGDPPVGTGGTMESGTYELTDARIFGSAGAGATGLSVRGKLELAITGTSGTFARVVATGAQGGTSIEDRDSGTLVVSGTTALLTLTCPTGGQEQFAYTATATTLVMTNVTSRESYTFTKR